MEISKEFWQKYLSMNKQEEIEFMSECINGKPKYSDHELSFALAIKFGVK